MTTIGFYLYYGFIWVFTLLPMRIQYLFSDLMYFIGYYLIRYRRRVTLENLKNSFPDRSKNELEKIARKFYRHLFDLLIESVATLHISEKEINRRVDFKNLELIEKYYSEKKNPIGVGGHYGNWEWTSHFALHTKLKVIPVYKPLNNKNFDNLFIRLRSRYGAVPVPMHQVLRKILEYNQMNILTISYFIGDQRPIKQHIKHWIKFLNQDTPVILGPEKMAVRLNEPVVFVNVQKRKRGYYYVEFIDLVEHPRETREFEITEKFMSLLERFITERPELWLWSHRRWRYQKSDVL